MKKDNIKVTPEVLLLTAILGVPTGEVKKDRAHRDGTHGDGERQKAHVKRAHGHAAQADGFHDQLNGDQQCQPGESTKIVILFHKNISSCCRSALDVGYGANLPAKGAGPFFYFTLECFVRERSKGR